MKGFPKKCVLPTYGLVDLPTDKVNQRGTPLLKINSIYLQFRVEPRNNRLLAEIITIPIHY